MYMYDVIAIILIGISHVFLYMRLIRYDRLSNIKVILLSIVFTFLLGFAVNVTGYPELNTVMTLLFLLSLGLMKNGLSFMQNLYFALVSMVSITFGKMVLMELGFQLFMWLPFNLYLWTSSVIHFIISISMFIAIILWGRRIQRLAQYIVESRLYYFSYVLLMIGLILLLVLTTPATNLLATVYEQYVEIGLIAAFILFLILLLIAIIGAHLAKERLVEAQQNQLEKERLDYVEKLELMHEELASFRHDYVNVLLALDTGVRMKDLQQIEQIYYNVIAPTSQLINNQELDLTKFSYITIPEVKSVLSVKVIAAQQQRLQVVVDIPQRIETIRMPVVDFIRVISILLDNAIEESIQSEEKELHIAFFEMEGQQYFIVKNSCQQESMDLQRLYKKHYSSKEGKRGYGLFSLKRLVDQTNYSTLETTFTAPYFTQTLLLKKW